MRSKLVIRTGTLAAACLAATAFAGLPWADASSHVPKTAAKRHAVKLRCLLIRDDSDDTPGCLPPGPKGLRGLRGLQGRTGPQGAVGPIGATGPIGPVGQRGPTGQQGIQGIQGIQGPPGAFSPGGAHPGGNTVIVPGTKIGPVPVPQGPEKALVLTPSVAVCPAAGPDTEAYDGGATITTANSSNQPTSNDVVGLQNSYPGIYNGQGEVDPLPLGATPGAVSTEPANAYQAQAVVTEMHSGDNVTVQAYVVCGP